MLIFFYLSLISFLFLMVLLLIVLWIRSVVIRFRYDKILSLIWKKFFFLLYLLLF
jgi:NADH:ubiquinone oxidoreductase subunit H